MQTHGKSLQAKRTPYIEALKQKKARLVCGTRREQEAIVGEETREMRKPEGQMHFCLYFNSKRNH